MTSPTASPSRVPVFGQDGYFLAAVTPSYLDKALARNEVGCDTDGTYRLRGTGGFRTKAQIDQDARADAWRKAHGPADIEADDELTARRKAAAAKAVATRKANEAARAAGTVAV